MNILLVENHEILRAGLESMLQAALQPDHIRAAGDGLSALSIAASMPPDLAIIDIHIPHLSGIETAQRLITAYPELIVIFLTVLSDSATVRKAFEAGAKGFVLKDDEPAELLNAVHRTQKGQFYLSSQLVGLIDLDAIVQQGRSAALGFGSLTDRQREVLALIASGLTIREIAEQTGLSTKTLDAHRRRIQQRLGVDSVAELTRAAIREGLVHLDGTIQATTQTTGVDNDSPVSKGSTHD